MNPTHLVSSSIPDNDMNTLSQYQCPISLQLGNFEPHQQQVKILLKVKRKTPSQVNPQHIAVHRIVDHLDFYPEDVQAMLHRNNKHRYHIDPSSNIHAAMTDTPSITNGDNANSLVSLFGDMSLLNSAENSTNITTNTRPHIAHTHSSSGYIPPQSSLFDFNNKTYQQHQLEINNRNNHALREKWGLPSCKGDDDSDHGNHYNNYLSRHTLFQHVGTTTKGIVEQPQHFEEWITTTSHGFSSSSSSTLMSPNFNGNIESTTTEATITPTQTHHHPIAIFEVETVENAQELIDSVTNNAHKHVDYFHHTHNPNNKSIWDIVYGSKNKNNDHHAHADDIISTNPLRSDLKLNYNEKNKTVSSIPGLKPPPPRRNVNRRAQHTQQQQFSSTSALSTSLLDRDTLAYLEQRKIDEQAHSLGDLTSVKKEPQLDKEEELYDIYEICYSDNVGINGTAATSISSSLSGIDHNNFAHVIPKKELDYLLATYHIDTLLQSSHHSTHDDFVNQFTSKSRNFPGLEIFGAPLFCHINNANNEDVAEHYQNRIIDGLDDDDYNRYHNDSDIDYPEESGDNSDDSHDGDNDDLSVNRYNCANHENSDGYSDDSAIEFYPHRQSPTNNAQKSTGRGGIDYGEELDMMDPQLREYIILQQSRYQHHVRSQQHDNNIDHSLHKLAGGFDDCNDNGDNDTTSDDVDAMSDGDDSSNKVNLESDLFTQFFNMQQLQHRHNGYDEGGDPYGGTNSFVQYRLGRRVQNWGDEE